MTQMSRHARPAFPAASESEKDVEASPILNRHIKAHPLGSVSASQYNTDEDHAPDQQGSSPYNLTQETSSSLCDHAQQEREDRDEEGIV
jgi:hypothetical protein